MEHPNVLVKLKQEKGIVRHLGQPVANWIPPREGRCSVLEAEAGVSQESLGVAATLAVFY